MSKNADRMPYQTAKAIAQKAIDAPFCKQIEVAGSIRRERETIGDIEIVCEPKGSLTGEKVEALLSGKVLKDGERYKKIILPNGVILDLYLVRPPAQWGFILALRTGPADFNQGLFIQAHRKNKKISFHEGCVFIDDIAIETPTEELFFEAVRQDWIDPIERLADEEKMESLMAWFRKDLGVRENVRKSAFLASSLRDIAAKELRGESQKNSAGKEKDVITISQSKHFPALQPMN